MEKKERKEAAKERKRKWSVVVVTGERKESVQGTKRRWDFYEWVDAFKGPKVNSLSKMIYWRKIHLFYVTPWNFFSPSSVLGMGSAMAEPEGCTDTPLPQQPCLDGKVQWVGSVAVRSLSQLNLSGGGESHHSHTGGGSDIAAEYWQPHPLPWGPPGPCPTFRLPPAESDRKTEEGARVSFLERLCVELKEQLVKQVRIWGFEHQGSFSPAFGLCNQKEIMDKACLDWEGNDPDHCTHLRYLDELNQTSQMPDLLLLL